MELCGVEVELGCSEGYNTFSWIWASLAVGLTGRAICTCYSIIAVSGSVSGGVSGGVSGAVRRGITGAVSGGVTVSRAVTVS